MRSPIWVIPIALGLTACGPTTSPSPSTPGVPHSVQPASGSAAASASATTVAADSGLRLVATFDRQEVEAGGTINVALSIENTRETDVVFEEPCGPNAMTVLIQVPVEPIGHAWHGIAAAFKTYALRESTGYPMESSIRTGLRTAASTKPCHAQNGAGGDGGGLPTTIIPSGTTYETALTWTAEIVPGVPAIPGSAPFSIRVAYDHRLAGAGLMRADTLEATGTITITDGAPGAVSAGQALDATLADAKFGKWLAKQPRKSWVNANLFIQPAAVRVAVLPDVPYWDVELFREPRSWAMVYVDARTGQVLQRSFCDIPCDR
jgi:hypothetical protein